LSATIRLLLAALLLALLVPSPAQAYVGPGAGFALAGSLFAVLAAFASAVLMLATWPILLPISSPLEKLRGVQLLGKLDIEPIVKTADPLLYRNRYPL
jgi:hypothetical protein